jgi:hypothetical protein
MVAKWRYCDFHEGEKRKRNQDLVQLRRSFDVKNAYVGVVTDNSPQMAPFSSVLQFLRPHHLVRAQFVDRLCIDVVRNVDIHSDVEQHGAMSAREPALH